MRILSIFTLICCLYLEVAGQNERVHLDLDRYTCKVGETIYFKGYLFMGARVSGYSTSLYVKLYTETGIEVAKAWFPILRGRTAGQVVIPNDLATDNYYLMAYTREQIGIDSDLFCVPILAYNRAAPANILHKTATKKFLGMTEGRINGIHWYTVVQNNHLSSQVEVDSGSRERRLLLVMPEGQDSAYRADRVLSAKIRSRYAIFPINNGNDVATLYLYEDSLLIGRQRIRIKPPIRRIKMRLDTLSAAPGASNVWTVILPDSGIYSASITVTDADRTIPSRRSINELTASYTDNFAAREIDADTSFMTLDGLVTDQKGGLLKSGDSLEIVAMAVKDTVAVFKKLQKVDSTGRFALDSLLLFGDNILDIQLNGNEYRDDYKVIVHTKPWPRASFDTMAVKWHWEDDSIGISGVDTAMTRTESKEWQLKRLHLLEPAYVIRKENSREKVDSLNEFFTTALFAEPTAFMFDPSMDNNAMSLDLYLRRHVPSILFDMNGRPTYQGKEVLFYVNEHPSNWEKVSSPGFVATLSFVKVFQNEEWQGNTGFTNQMIAASAETIRLPFPGGETKATKKTDGGIDAGRNDQMVIALYTSKGRDVRMLGGQLHQAVVTGYNSLLSFQPNGVTLFWAPFVSGNVIPIRFLNSNSARRFRLKIEGVTLTGNTFHYEAFIDPKRK